MGPVKSRKSYLGECSVQVEPWQGDKTGKMYWNQVGQLSNAGMWSGNLLSCDPFK